MSVDPDYAVRRLRRKKSASEAELVAAALRCFVRQGVERATMDSICTEARMSMGSAYHAVPGGKPALLLAAYKQVSYDLLSHLRAPSAEASADPAKLIRSSLLEPYVVWFDEHHQEAVFLLQVEAMWFEPDIKLMINEVAGEAHRRVLSILAMMAPKRDNRDVKSDRFAEALVFGQVRILLAQCLRGARRFEVVRQELPALARAVAASLSGYHARVPPPRSGSSS